MFDRGLRNSIQHLIGLTREDEGRTVTSLAPVHGMLEDSLIREQWPAEVEKALRLIRSEIETYNRHAVISRRGGARDGHHGDFDAIINRIRELNRFLGPDRITEIEFQNFKSLVKAKLPLERFTLLIGPNGSGKSSVMQALLWLKQPGRYHRSHVITASKRKSTEPLSIAATWQFVGEEPWQIQLKAAHQGSTADFDVHPLGGVPRAQDKEAFIRRSISSTGVYSLDPGNIVEGRTLEMKPELGERGHGLAGILDWLRDHHPERFDSLNDEFGRWLPEYDKVLFELVGPTQRAFMLRTREGWNAIPAEHLSQGTVIALTLLTIAYLPQPPAIIGLEEPDRGVHPRLLRDVRDAIYRLAYPEAFGEQREPVQVIATTHSPYLLDLFSEHPKEIVIAHKQGEGAQFKRLSDIEHLDEILSDAHLSDIWYTGVLGGVPER